MCAEKTVPSGRRLVGFRHRVGAQLQALLFLPLHQQPRNPPSYHDLFTQKNNNNKPGAREREIGRSGGRSKTEAGREASAAAPQIRNQKGEQQGGGEVRGWAVRGGRRATHGGVRAEEVQVDEAEVEGDGAGGVRHMFGEVQGRRDTGAPSVRAQVPFSVSGSVAGVQFSLPLLQIQDPHYSLINHFSSLLSINQCVFFLE